MQIVVAVVMALGVSSIPQWKEAPLQYVTQVVVHPVEPDRVVANASGGLHASQDGGLTWTVPAGAPFNILTLFVHPGRPNLIFAHEDRWYAVRLGGADSGGGALYLSEDFGLSWAIVRPPLDESMAPFASDPEDPERLFGTKRTGSVYRPGSFPAPSYNTSVLESRDMGHTWAPRGNGLPSGDAALGKDVTGPTAASRGKLFYTALGGVYVSRDSALTWTPFAALRDLRWIRSDPFHPQVIYSYQEGISVDGAAPGILLRSDDDGATWNEIFRRGAMVLGQVPELTIDPGDSSRLWLSGVAEGVLFSSDGASTWQSLGLAGSRYLQCDTRTCIAPIDGYTVAHGLAFSPAAPDVIYVIRGGRLLVAHLGSDMPRRAVEFHRASDDRYWVTANAGEAQVIDFSNKVADVHRTGKSFAVWNEAAAGRVAVCRFQGNDVFGIHSRFLTLSGDECEAVKRSPAWKLESDDYFFALPFTSSGCPADSAPLGRFFNGRSDANHRYVTDEATASEMSARGWIGEGIVMCTAPQ